MSYWSNILLEKPSTIQANTEKKHNLLVINNAKINNKTNAVVENLFKHKKVDKPMLNEPIIDYIKRIYQVNTGLKRHFLDELLKIDNAKLLQDSSMSNRDVGTLSSLRETSKSSPSPKMYKKANVLKEIFKKEKKKPSTNSSLLVPPKNKKIKFIFTLSKQHLRYKTDLVNVPEKVLLHSPYSRSNSLKKRL